jgi:prepilin-type N-terminal cleavage/methylation domain-containing protein
MHRVGYLASRKSPHMRVLKGRQRSSVRPRGFTLIEVLVVLTIIGIIALIGSIEISRASQRAKLYGVANDLRAFFAQAASEMSKVRCLNAGCTSTAQYEVFLEIAPQDTDGTTPVRLYTDDNQDGILTVGSDSVVAKYTIPSSIVLAPGVTPTAVNDCLYGGTNCDVYNFAAGTPPTGTCGTATGAKTHVASLNWSWDDDSVSQKRALKLNYKNRAINTVYGPTSSTMINGWRCSGGSSVAGTGSSFAKLALTHKNMTSSGSGLTPVTTYEIWISPVWDVTIHKGVWDGTKFNYPSTTGLGSGNL